MSQPDITHLRPEIAAAFYGPAPLISARSFFDSRKELVDAYTLIQTNTFSLKTARPDQCDICGRNEEPAAWIVVTWVACVRWYPRQVMLLVLLLPIVLPMVLVHLGFILAPLLGKLKFREFSAFVTYHPICAGCRRKQQARAIFLAALAVVAGFIVVVSGIASMVLAAMIISDLLGAFGFRPADATVPLELFVPAVVVCLGGTWVAKRLGSYLSLPGAIRGLVKRPFVQYATELRKPEDFATPVAFFKGI